MRCNYDDELYLLAYFYQKSSPVQLSLTKIAVIGSAVGLAGGILYFICGAVILIVAGNNEYSFYTNSISLAVIAVVQLTVAAGLDSLVVGLLSKARLRAVRPKNEITVSPVS
jgi:hypothetical protein